jgi:hypothetical protein
LAAPHLIEWMARFTPCRQGKRTQNRLAVEPRDMTCLRGGPVSAFAQRQIQRPGVFGRRGMETAKASTSSTRMPSC